ncbi:hypothetical protein BR63_19030 [Thermanaerosceptrum fracticalcis]|uniref:Uncharacterized protein n=1 Tax=Thermanaerosceptrum fracticalcis TaxID=1712410 RepID=A0A7G6E7X3_THEFR|nr:hypothetical protein [Thermanaerosceptrum fracticalcis]QNB48177.1 hypothetical protein BR63_19030 [Thermanaerosceptrum fracticalcis]
METILSNFYLKYKLAEGVEIRVELTEDNVFTRCPGCGAEVQVDENMLFHVYTQGDLYSTNFYCGECGLKAR